MNFVVRGRATLFAYVQNCVFGAKKKDISDMLGPVQKYGVVRVKYGRRTGKLRV